MARTALSYRIRLFRGNRPVAQARLRFATSFEIWYGKRRVLARREFPYKRVGERRDLLEQLVERIELRRQKILAKARRRRAQERKAFQRLERERHRKTLARQRINRDVVKPKLKREEKGIFNQAFDRATVHLPAFRKVYAEEPTEAKKAIVRDTLIIPMEPESRKFVKRIVDKMMRNSIFGDYHLAIMDFTLIPEEYIQMTAENFREAYKEAYLKLMPHVANYFLDTKKSSDMFILRIKFLHQWDTEEQYTPHGISYHRMQLTSADQIINLFRDTFLRLFGDKSDPYTTKNRFRANYLQGDSSIYITGFTLEATRFDRRKKS